MHTGTIVSKREGYGFIKVDGAPEGSKDLFFHANELKGVSFDELVAEDAATGVKGNRVSFEIGQSPKGPNATGVSKI